MPLNNPEAFPNFARFKALTGGGAASEMSWGKIATFSAIGLLVVLILVWLTSEDKPARKPAARRSRKRAQPE